MSALPGYDLWLGSYSSAEVEAWCANKTCPNHEGAAVTYEKEFGQGWYSPEECWICHSEWFDDEPEEEDEDDDDGE